MTSVVIDEVFTGGAGRLFQPPGKTGRKILSCGRFPVRQACPFMPNSGITYILAKSKPLHTIAGNYLNLYR
jgi:hypothetical protein